MIPEIGTAITILFQVLQYSVPNCDNCIWNVSPPLLSGVTLSRLVSHN